MAFMDVCPLASELSVINKNIVCPEQGCGKVFKASSLLTMHLTKHHRNACLRKRDASVLVRYFCPEESCVYHVNASRHFTQMKYLKQHYLKVHSEKKYACQTCTKGFATEDLLRHHHQTCGIKFICSCENSYSSYEALLTHSKRKQHTFDEKYKTANRRSKPNIVNFRKHENLFGRSDTVQPIYILPKASTEPINGLPVNMLAAVALTELSKSCSAFVSNKEMQTDPVDTKRRKVGSPSKTFERATKRRASAQTQTGGTLKNRRPKNTAETQTVGECILKRAMEEANILHKAGDVSHKFFDHFCGRKSSAETQTVYKKSVHVTSSSFSQSDEFPSDEPLSPSSCPAFSISRDIGLPDLWLSQKNSSSTQTSPRSGNICVPLVEDGDSNSAPQTDLNLAFFGQDGALCSASNIQSIFEDNSDSFDNVVSVASHFDATTSSGNMNGLDSLTNPGFSPGNRSCNMETQTEQVTNNFFPKQCSENTDTTSFALSSTIETQTTGDLSDLDTLLYSNMCTQTCDETLFSDLDFVDIQTQTAWPCYGEESNESVLVSTETQTAISSCGFSFNLPDSSSKGLINDASHHETQTNENDLKDLMAELVDQEVSKQIL